MRTFPGFDYLNDGLPRYECSYAEDLSEIIDVLNAIPDGVRLADFPGHGSGAECWCRPRIDSALGQILVHHKNLAKGEFDS